MNQAKEAERPWEAALVANETDRSDRPIRGAGLDRRSPVWSSASRAHNVTQPMALLSRTYPPQR